MQPIDSSKFENQKRKKKDCLKNIKDIKKYKISYWLFNLIPLILYLYLISIAVKFLLPNNISALTINRIYAIVSRLRKFQR